MPKRKTQPSKPKAGKTIGVMLRAAAWRRIAREFVDRSQSFQDPANRSVLVGLAGVAMKRCAEKPGEELVEVESPRDYWCTAASELVASAISPRIGHAIACQLSKQEEE